MKRYLWQPSAVQEIGLYPDGSLMQTCKNCAHSSRGGSNKSCPFHPLIQKVKGRPGYVQMLNPCTGLTTIYKEEAIVEVRERDVQRAHNLIRKRKIPQKEHVVS